MSLICFASRLSLRAGTGLIKRNDGGPSGLHSCWIDLQVSVQAGQRHSTKKISPPSSLVQTMNTKLGYVPVLPRSLTIRLVSLGRTPENPCIHPPKRRQAGLRRSVRSGLFFESPDSWVALMFMSIDQIKRKIISCDIEILTISSPQSNSVSPNISNMSLEVWTCKLPSFKISHPSPPFFSIKRLCTNLNSPNFLSVSAISRLAVIWVPWKLRLPSVEHQMSMSLFSAHTLHSVSMLVHVCLWKCFANQVQLRLLQVVRLVKLYRVIST